MRYKFAPGILTFILTLYFGIQTLCRLLTFFLGDPYKSSLIACYQSILPRVPVNRTLQFSFFC